MVLPLIAGIAGPLIGGLASAWGASEANKTSERNTERQIAAQQESVRNSYQWGMEDMRKAGLNPILAYKQGGAGAISGSTYSPQSVGGAFASGAAQGSSAASSAIQAQRQETELANIQADTALKASQDKTQSALQIQAMAQAGQANANAALAGVQAGQAQMNTDLQRSILFQQLPKEQLAKLDAAFYMSPAAVPWHTARRWSEAIRGVGDAASAINPFR